MEKNSINVWESIFNTESTKYAAAIIDKNRRDLEMIKRSWQQQLDQDKQDSLETEKQFWINQSKASASDLLKTYNMRLANFKRQYKDSDENDFIIKEITHFENLKTRNPKITEEQKQVHYTTDKFLKELQRIQKNILEDQNDAPLIPDDGKPLSTTLSRVDLTLLCTLLKDAGIVSPGVSDYQLGKWAERSLFYDVDKPMKAIGAEISKIRNFEINEGDNIEKLKEKLLKTDVKKKG